MLKLYLINTKTMKGKRNTMVLFEGCTASGDATNRI
jgi:hypothetical protein